MIKLTEEKSLYCFMSIQKSSGAWIHPPLQQVGEASSHEENDSASLEHPEEFGNVQRSLWFSKGTNDPTTPPKKPRVTTFLSVIGARWEQTE